MTPTTGTTADGKGGLEPPGKETAAGPDDHGGQDPVVVAAAADRELEDDDDDNDAADDSGTPSDDDSFDDESDDADDGDASHGASPGKDNKNGDDQRGISSGSSDGAGSAIKDDAGVGKRRGNDDDEGDTPLVKDGEDGPGEPSSAPPVPSPPPPKRAKIAMPPAVPAALLDVDEYQLDEPAPSVVSDEATADAGAAPGDDVDSKIVTPNLILFGLHPLVREAPLRKMCERYGTVTSMTVRSAFANRYGHVGYETVGQAKAAYIALNGAKLLHKTLLVQPAAGGL